MRHSLLKFGHMHLCGKIYKCFSPHCCKCNSCGCIAAIGCVNACRGPHCDSVYSGSEHRQFNSPRQVKREAGFPNPRRALIGSNQLWRVNDSPYYRELPSDLYTRRQNHVTEMSLCQYTAHNHAPHTCLRMTHCHWPSRLDPNRCDINSLVDHWSNITLFTRQMASAESIDILAHRGNSYEQIDTMVFVPLNIKWRLRCSNTCVALH